MKKGFQKLKKDKKSLLLMGYSIGLILVFAIGTVVTNNSISTLSKKLNAPANANFTDDALYRCVIDAYNEENHASKSYSANLTDAEMQSITKLVCSDEGVTSTEGLQKLKNLEELDLSNNQLTGLAGAMYSAPLLTNFTNLKKLVLDNNQLTGNYFVINSLSNLEYLSIKNNQITGFNSASMRDEYGNEIPGHNYTIFNTKLKYLDVSHNNLSNINLSKATELTEVHVDNNKLKKIDLSSNTNLTTDKTTISDNPFEEEVYVFKYNGKGIKVQSTVTLPSSVDFGDVTWGSSSNANIATIDDYQIIKPGNVGSATIVGTAGNKYRTTSNIHVVDLNINSSKYKLNVPTNPHAWFSCLWIGSDASKSSSEISSNLSINGASSGVSIIIVNAGENFLDQEAHLLIRDTYRGRDIADFPIYGATSSVDYYDVDSNYIYKGGNKTNLSVTTGLTKKLEGSKFVIQTNTTYQTVKSYDLVDYTSNKYDINIDSNYIWVGTDTINQDVIDSTISVTNGSMRYNSVEHTLTLKDGAGATIKTWDIVGWYSNDYTINEYHINTNGKEFSENKITTVNCYFDGVDARGNHILKYRKNGETIRTILIVSYVSDKYQQYINKDYIDIGTGEFSASDINTNLAIEYSSEDNTVTLMTYYPVKTWDVVSYKSDKYNLDGNYIYVGNNASLEDITSNITATNVTFSKNAYNQLEFKYNNEVIKTMDIVYCDSSYYDLSKKYIFTGSVSNEFIKSKIDYDESNSSLDIVNNNLVLKASNGETIKSWKLVRCENEGFVFGKSYAVRKPTYSNDILEGMEVTNGTYNGITTSYNGSKSVSISFNGETVGLPILNLKSTNDKYNLENLNGGPHLAYIYVGTGYPDTGNIRLWFNSYADVSEQLPDTFEVTANDEYMTAKIAGQEIFKWYVIRITSEYEINNGFIIVNGENINMDKVHSTYSIIPFEFKVQDGVLYYGNHYAPNEAQEGKWSIVNITSNKYSVGDGVITIKDEEFAPDNIDVQVPSSVTYTDSYDSNNNTYTITVNEESRSVTKTYRVEKSKFKDDNLYKCVVDSYNSKNSTNVGYGEILTSGQLATITNLTCSGKNKSDDKKITDTTGIEKLTGLTRLELDNNSISSINLRDNHSITRLVMDNNSLTSLNVSNVAALKELYARNNQLTSLDVSHNPSLTNLGVNNNKLTSLDLSSNTALIGLAVPGNQITALNVYNLTNLKTLDASSNQIASLNLPNNTVLYGLNLDSNNIAYVDVKKYIALESLRISNNRLSSIDLSHNTALQTIDVSNNYLTSLDLSHNTALMTDGVSNREVKIANNRYSKNMSVDLGVPSEIDSPVKIPAHLNWNSPTYTVGEPSYATVTGSSVTAKKTGTFAIVGSVADKYSFTITVTANGNYYSSTKYNLNNSYIYVEGEFNPAAITTIGDAEVKWDANNSIVKVMVGDQLINQWDVLSINPDTYVISGNTIYVGPNQILSEFESKINKKKLDMNVSDVNGNSIVDTGDTVTFTNTTHNFSKTYDISSDGIDYGDLEIDGDIIRNVKVGTRLSEIANKIETNATVTTHDKDGNVVDREARTGDQIVITWDSGNIITFRVSVLGDVNCDGKVDMSDYKKFQRHVLKTINPNESNYSAWEIITEEYRLIAGDINNNGDTQGDGQYNMSDAIRLRRYALAIAAPDQYGDWMINYIALGVVNVGGVINGK